MKEALKNFLGAEYIAEEQNLIPNYELTVDERVRRGLCITDLQFLRRDGDLWTYRYKQNKSHFEEGRLLTISPGKPVGRDAFSKEHRIPVFMHRINPHNETVAIRKAFGETADPPTDVECTLDEACHDFGSERHKRCVDLVFDNPALSEFIHGNPKRLMERADKLNVAAVNSIEELVRGIPCKQQLAMEMALTAPITLIEGPPGSGKTVVLAKIVEAMVHAFQIARRPCSILITAPTRRAIHLLMNRVEELLRHNEHLKELLSSGHLRLVNLSAIPQETSHHRRKSQVINCEGGGTAPSLIENWQYDAFKRELGTIDTAFILGTTVHQLTKLGRPSSNEFTLAICDEASQLHFAHFFPVMLWSQRFVIAGDDRQLVTTSHGKYGPEIPESTFTYFRNLRLANESNFQYEPYAHNHVMLDHSFRMNAEICHFPNQQFYTGRLLSSADVQPFPLPHQFLDCMICKGSGVTHLELQHTSSGCLSTDEADVVVEIARALIMSHNLKPLDLAIMAPFNAQIQEIRKRVYSNIDLKPIAQEILMGTVDRIQGQEREVAIFSAASSDKDYIKHFTDLVYSPNRLNVAMTRCRSRLFVVSSKYFFPQHNGLKIPDAHSKVFSALYEYLSPRRICVNNAADLELFAYRVPPHTAATATFV